MPLFFHRQYHRPVNIIKNAISMCHLLVYLILTSHLIKAAPTGSPADYPRYESGVLYLYDKAIALNDGYELSIQGVLAGIVLLVLGMGLWLRGFIDSTGILTRFFVGFLSFGFISWVMLANFEPESTYGVNRWSLYLAVVVALGLVGGLLFCLCDLIAVYAAMLGGLGGLAIGLWVLGWKDNLSITSSWGRAVLLCLLALVGFLWASYSVNASILGSAFAGSYIIMLGLDVYFHTGFTYCATTVLDVNPAHAHVYVVYRETYVMQGAIILAFIVGFVSQIMQRSLLTIQHHFENRPVFLSSMKYGMRQRWNPFGPTAIAVAPP